MVDRALAEVIANMADTSTAWTAFMSNLPATIAATGALIVSVAGLVTSLRNGRKADNAAVLAVDAVAKADSADKQITVIRTNTDGSLTQLQQDIALARQEIDALKAAREVAAVKVALDTPVGTVGNGQ